MEPRTLPATPHLYRPNPQLSLVGSAFRLVDALQEWRSDGLHIAGVSSFGIGGTNCHVVVRQAPELPAATVEAGRQPRARSTRATRKATGIEPTVLPCNGLTSDEYSQPESRTADRHTTRWGPNIDEKLKRQA
ncbi:ketoacyl-synthetase C-terminal extension domain-containing protein [Kutzneria buriramensis]|uniref:ketoacyl-synthetase C-terminal extension domain-containing protein n=1 Tax=Kutzneria buriramensis TaxID=1045776 RepID=UPI0035EC3B6F